jgi:DNA-binding beta-propeller fold protein YncE
MHCSLARTALCALLAVAAFAGCASQSASTAGPYRIVETIPVGGNGHWDHVDFDPVGRRLFLSHNSHVDVVDAVSHRRLGRIDVDGFAHGVALVPGRNLGFVTVGTSSFAPGAEAHEVAVFDLRTLRAAGKIAMPADPDGIVYEPVSKRVIAFTGETHEMVAIDPATLRIVKTVDLRKAPGSAKDDGRGHLYVTIEDDGDVLEFDTRTFALLKRLPVAGCRKPVGVALSPATDRIFVACRNRTLAVLDLATGANVAQVPIARHNDAMVYDPSTRTMFVSTLDGTLSIVRDEGGDRYRLLENLPTFPGARTLALDPATHRVYISYAKLAPLPLGAIRYPDPIDGTFAALVIAREQP